MRWQELIQSPQRVCIDEVEYRQSDVVGPEPQLEPESEADENPFRTLLKGMKRYGFRRLEGLPEAGDFEVVVRGRVVDSVSHELLLTSYYNEPWFGDTGSATLDLRGLGEFCHLTQLRTFVYAIRRPKHVWARLNKRMAWRHYMEYSPAGVTVGRRHKVWVAIDRAVDYAFQVREGMIECCGSTFVCEPRFAERVATVWRLQVRLSPVVLADEIQGAEPTYVGWVGRLNGPFDDVIIYYRGELDGTLARLEPPKYPYGVADLPGREQ